MGCFDEGALEGCRPSRAAWDRCCEGPPGILCLMRACHRSPEPANTYRITHGSPQEAVSFVQLPWGEIGGRNGGDGSGNHQEAIKSPLLAGAAGFLICAVALHIPCVAGAGGSGERLQEFKAASLLTRPILCCEAGAPKNAPQPADVAIAHAAGPPVEVAVARRLCSVPLCILHTLRRPGLIPLAAAPPGSWRVARGANRTTQELNGRKQSGKSVAEFPG